MTMRKTDIQRSSTALQLKRSWVPAGVLPITPMAGDVCLMSAGLWTNGKIADS